MEKKFMHVIAITYLSVLRTEINSTIVLLEQMLILGARTGKKCKFGF